MKQTSKVLLLNLSVFLAMAIVCYFIVFLTTDRNKSAEINSQRVERSDDYIQGYNVGRQEGYTKGYDDGYYDCVENNGYQN